MSSKSIEVRHPAKFVLGLFECMPGSGFTHSSEVCVCLCVCMWYVNEI